MRHLAILIVALALFATVSSVAPATAYYFQDKSNFKSLSFNRAYYWGIQFTLPTDQEITGATFTFNNISSKNKPNRLYLSVLEDLSGKKNVTHKTYLDKNRAFADYFDSWRLGGSALNTFRNLGKKATMLSYSFSADELDTLQSYLQNGRFAIGIDSDGKYKDTGIRLKIYTGPISSGNNDSPGGITKVIPEPSTVIMALAGLLPAIGGVLRLRHKR